MNTDDNLEYPPLDVDWLHSECHFQIKGKNGRVIMGQCQALHLASGRGNIACMEMLLEAGRAGSEEKRWSSPGPGGCEREVDARRQGRHESS